MSFLLNFQVEILIAVHLSFTELRIVNMGLISNGTTLLDVGVIDSGISTGAMVLLSTQTAFVHLQYHLLQE